MCIVHCSLGNMLMFCGPYNWKEGRSYPHLIDEETKVQCSCGVAETEEAHSDWALGANLAITAPGES